MTSSTDDILAINTASEVSSFFQVLADPTRVRIVKALADRRWSVSALADALDMDQPAISHQLKYLRQLGIVQWQKKGRHVYYRLNHPLLCDVLNRVIDDTSA